MWSFLFYRKMYYCFVLTNFDDQRYTFFPGITPGIKWKMRRGMPSDTNYSIPQFSKVYLTIWGNYCILVIIYWKFVIDFCTFAFYTQKVRLTKRISTFFCDLIRAFGNVYFQFWDILQKLKLSRKN